MRTPFRRLITLSLGLLLAVGLGLALTGNRPAAAKRKQAPRMEVVFALDTTGSMAGLIEGAKRKVWSIVNELLNGKPRPELRLGLVAYRDRKDAYVTKLTPLTQDLDALYGDLMALQAKGGGDTPESVNQALNEAVTKMEWTEGGEVLKIVFLVGDAPPHMDYPDDVKFADTCQVAVRRNIIINTVQCGSITGTREIWEQIARASEGRFAAIPANGGTEVVATPFDAELEQANSALVATAQFYGDKKAKSKAEENLRASSSDAAFDRAGFGGAAGALARREVRAGQASVRAKLGRLAEGDFLDDYQAGKIKLDEVEEEELPDELQGLTPKQRQKTLKKLVARRQKMLKRILKLSRKREEYLARERKKKPETRDAFDQQVLDQIRDQAKRIGVKY